jgi:hypothetical protein
MIVKGRNIKIGNIPVQPEPEIPNATEIVITLTLNSPGTATVINKYNSNKHVFMQFDDNYSGVKNIAPVLNLRKGSDGANGQIPFRASVAVNGHNSYNGLEWGLPGFGKLLYSEYAAIINAGFDVENHSDYHANLSTLLAAKNDVVANNLLHFTKIGYLMNVGVVPTDFSYYTQAWKDLNFFGSITQGARDGLPIYPNNINWSNPQWRRTIGDLNEIPAGFAQIYRAFTENWSTSDVTNLKTLIDAIVSNSNSSTDYFLAIGAHSWTQSSFQNFIDYVETAGGFTVTSLREMLEYKWLKENQSSFITQVQDGNQLTITYDLNALPNQIRWRDLTFKLTDGVTVQSMTAVGADNSSFSGNIFNVFKDKKSWLTSDLNPL